MREITVKDFEQAIQKFCFGNDDVIYRRSKEAAQACYDLAIRMVTAASNKTAAMKSGIELIRKIKNYNEGIGEYNFSNLKDYDMSNASFDAWQKIKEEIDRFVESTPASDAVDWDEMYDELMKTKMAISHFHREQVFNFIKSQLSKP